jgi:hypothetical protein
MSSLVPTTAAALIASQQQASVAVVSDCTGGMFLPQLRMTSPKSAAVEAEEVAAYRFVKIVDSEVDHVYGEQVDLLICGVRNRASREIDGEQFISFDPESDFYKECLALNEGGDRSALAGRELLVYAPDTGDFLTFFFGNKTMRRTAQGQFKGIVGKFGTAYAKLITIKDRVVKGKTIKGTTYKSPKFKFHDGNDTFSADDLDFSDLQLAIQKFEDRKDKLPEFDDDEQDDR